MKKLPTLLQIKQWMVRIANENGIPKQVGNTWRHSTVVWRFSHKIAELAIKNDYKIDLKFLKIACYTHDIGRMFTGSKASKILKPAIFHFYEGYYLMKKIGYPKLASLCVCHGAGTGLAKKINKKYGFIARDFFPRSIEEKIIAYADCRTNFQKGKGPVIFPFRYAYNCFKKYPGCGKRLKENHQFIKKITGNKIN